MLVKCSEAQYNNRAKYELKPVLPTTTNTAVSLLAPGGMLGLLI